MTLLSLCCCSSLQTAADRHLQPTTLSGAVGVLLGSYRLQSHREYLRVLQLCEEQQLPLRGSVAKGVARGLRCC